MGIGIGILLLVIGLILLFAINEFPASVQEVVEPITVGWISSSPASSRSCSDW